MSRLTDSLRRHDPNPNRRPDVKERRSTAAMDFDDWMVAADRICYRRLGTHTTDYDPAQFADWFDQGVSASEAVTIIATEQDR